MIRFTVPEIGAASILKRCETQANDRTEGVASLPIHTPRFITQNVLLVVLATPVVSCPLVGCQPLSPPPNEGRLEVREISLGRLPEGVSWDDVGVSPDQAHIAFKVKRSGQELVVVDGQEGPAFDAVPHGPRFSPDSNRVGYVARRGDSYRIVVDGVEGKGYEPSNDMYPIFSPDSKRLAFMARRGREAIMVVDGVEGKPYKSLRTQAPPPVFSPDSKRFAYAAETREEKWVMVVDGVEGKTYDCVYQPQFSPDSQRILYEATRNGESHVVVDGVEGPAFASVSLFSSVGTHFSPDSRRVAYMAHPKTGADVMVVDGQPGKTYEDIEFLPRIFTPDSTRTCYVAKVGDKQCVVLDGQEDPPYDRIEWFPRFSPDGAHMAYVAVRGKETLLVRDGTEIAGYSIINGPVFSPDSQHLAYAAGKGWTWTVVCDGREGLQHRLGNVLRTEVCFSPDSKRIAYRASQSRTVEFVVVDEVQSELYELVEPLCPLFSPDSKHLVYWGAPAWGQWHVFVDGSYSAGYDRPFFNTEPVFDRPDSFHALAVRGREILRLEMKVLSSESPEGAQQDR